MRKHRYEHVLVLGGSVGGLMAARVLSDHARKVSLLERDELGEEAEPRKGTPQALHTHGLLASGYRVIEALFPGFGEEARENGASSVDVGTESLLFVGGGAVARFESDLRVPLMSRRLVEKLLRRRVRALLNVTFRTGIDVQGFVARGRRVTGVRCHQGQAGQALEITGDLIVDSMGRGSRGHAFIEDLAGQKLEQETVTADIRYGTRVFRRPPHTPSDPLFAINGVEPPGRRGGVMVVCENESVYVTLVGYLGERVPLELEDFRAFARTLQCSAISSLVDRAEPIEEPRTFGIPGSVRWRYERLRRPPEGYLVFGDALAAVNPVHGQGMSILALEASVLDRCLARNTRDLWADFLEGAAAVVDRAWGFSAGADLTFPEVKGVRPPGAAIIGDCLNRVFRAAHHDPEVARTMVRVLQLVDPPTALLHPRVLWPVLRRTARDLAPWAARTA